MLLHLKTSVHGRVLYEDATGSALGLVVAFHGYGQSADDMLAAVRRIPGVGRWRIAAVQALHRFYGRDQQSVIASWMTRQDREQAIADNVEYIGRVVDQLPDPTLRPEEPTAQPMVFVGFSQGASMAYRAAVLGRHRAAGVVALGGDIPPELKTDVDFDRGADAWPPVLIGAGTRDIWFNQKLDADVGFLASRRIPHRVVRFDGAHEWTDEFRAEVGRWLADRSSTHRAR